MRFLRSPETGGTKFLVARGGIEPPTQGFSRLRSNTRIVRQWASPGTEAGSSSFFTQQRGQASPGSRRQSAQNELRRFRRCVPVRKVTASLEPVYAGIRKQFHGTLGFSGKAHPVLSSPSDDERVRDCVS